jgi:DNA (cytosine-5)-methyltransferase 1
MVQLGYGCAWRILDAQYFSLAQRRRRVFVVGYLGDWRRSAAVLFERHSLQGHSAPRREAGESVAGTLGGSSQSGGFRTTDLDNNGAFIPVTGKTLLSFGHAANPLDENLISFTDKVRRLSPRECERLQGFPDDYTLVPHRGKTNADGPRYKALGNSMAVPVMRWIGQRIAASERRHAA